jgi:hypothetical protein
MEKRESLNRERPVSYWESRVLGWERRRYGKFAKYSPFSYAVFNRQERALRILERLLNADTEINSILSLACGSGLLAERLNPARPVSYHGIDSSTEAIRRARDRRYHDNLRASFECANLPIKALPLAKIAVALGFFDWLTDESISGVLSGLSSQYLIVSFSDEEKRLLKRIFFLYHRGNRTLPEQAGYFPRVFSVESICRHLSCHGYSVVEMHAGIGLGLGNILVAKRLGAR